MTVLLAAVVGYLAARLLWVLLRPLWSDAVLVRHNYRGHPVPTGTGVVLVLTVVAVEGGRAAAGSVGIGARVGPDAPRLAVAVVALGMGLLGLLDDLTGAGDARGFRGHVRALARGSLTAGGVKLVGGAAVALTGTAVVLGEGASAGRLVIDAAVVGLAANLANLLDRAPGRVIKVGLASFVVLAVATMAAATLAAVAVVAGAAAALLVDDLHEHLMLGDAGANVLGGVVGLGVVATCGPVTRVVALAVLGVLNVASEFVSFSRVIDGVPPLRALDRAGRRAG